MPINVRSLAVKIATVWFFVTAIIGWVNQLSPVTCCRKAFVGSMAVFMVSVVAGRIINIIMFEAIVSQQEKKLTEDQDINAN